MVRLAWSGLTELVTGWIPVPMSFVGPGLAKPKEIRDTKALWWDSCHLYTCGRGILGPVPSCEGPCLWLLTSCLCPHPVQGSMASGEDNQCI